MTSTTRNIVAEVRAAVAASAVAGAGSAVVAVLLCAVVSDVDAQGAFVARLARIRALRREAAAALAHALLALDRAPSATRTATRDFCSTAAKLASIHSASTG